MSKGKLWFLLIGLGILGLATTHALMQEDENDPDAPPGFHGKFDEAEYIRQREAFVALLRGNDPSHPVDPQIRTRAIAKMDEQLAAVREAVAKSQHTNHPLAFPNWVELGPNPIPNGQTQTVTSAVSGRVSVIEIDPTDPNKVYVGAAQGGLYRSLDGGATWTAIFDSAQTLAIGALTLDTANNRLWVGTGEPNGSADSFAGVGIYRIDSPATTATLVGPFNPVRNYLDASSNPQSVPAFNGRSISKILINPANANELLVGAAGGVIGLGGNPPFGNSIPPLSLRGLWKMSNAGGAPASATITRIAITSAPAAGTCFDTPCTGNRNVNDMVYDLSDPTGNTVVVWMNGLNAAGDGGIYRSTNALGGAPTFTQTFITPATSTSNARGQFAIAQLAPNPARIYVASGEPSTGGSLCNTAAQAGGLRRSTDGGATWSTELPGGGGFCDGQCFYNIGFDLVAGATSATDKLLLGGNVRSTNCQKLAGTSVDGAATVFANTDVGLHADTHVMKVAPSNASIVYRGDDGGVWKSTDGGGTWASLNNTTFKATQFQSIAVHPIDPDFTIGGTQDNGTEKLTTGPTWIRSDAGDGGFALIDQNAADTTNVTMYHTYFNQTGTQIGYVRSTNAGTSWPFSALCANGISCADTTNFYAPMTLGPGVPNTIYFGSDRLYRSSTSGTANTVVSQAPITAGVPISGIGISLSDDNYRIVGLNNGGLFFTTTGSSTLTSLDPVGAGSVIPDFYVARLVFDPSNKNTVYIALGNYSGGTAASQSHVWKVTNLNTTPVLTAVNGSGITGLPDVPVNGFAIDPQKSTRLFAGTDIGVYISEDSGGTWSPYGQGLPRVAVFDIAIQNVKRVLRIATHGRGMWEIPLFAPTAASARISGQVTADDGTPLAGVTIRLSGALAATAITDSNGNYRFSNAVAGGFYTVTPELANYSFSPADRSFSLVADKTDAVFTGQPDATATANAIDSSEYFVRQHYLDFLGREPEAGGLRYWSDRLAACHGDAGCLRATRIDVSAAFFMSQEFADTGSFVYRLYRGALGRQLRYNEFAADRAQVVGGPNLESSKTAFANAFVQRAEFAQKYQDNQTAASFVDALLITMNDSVSVNLAGERDALIVRYNSGGSLAESRALVVRDLIDNATFTTRVYNESFVAMEYYGYLRRNWDANGFNFWLGVMNTTGDHRGMVCSFITSAEYQHRFGSVVSHSNAECGQ